MIILDVRREGGGGGAVIGFAALGPVLQARDVVSRKNRFKNQINCNANNN